ncbi:MAG: transketolase family protein [Candidatus Bipolaricaulota bacterium]|nr:transketolase family protein [Candidatus Bipolaricaulota bacterium]MDW8141511.1 transketolase family protein [Candidatus Bipolaricaulota bacterium]
MSTKTPPRHGEGSQGVRFLETRNAFGEALLELAAKDRDIVALTADLPGSTRLSWFKEKFPERFFDFGVAEANMIGVAAGLALSGKKPFVSTFAIFVEKAFEQIRQTIAYNKLPVKIVATHGGLTVGEDGASHQTVEDLALMRALPQMTVVIPADYYEAKRAIHRIYEHPGPVYVRLARAAFPVVFDESYEFELGKAQIVREGGDVTICACGLMLYYSLQAAQLLEREGIAAQVLNVSTLKPLDERIVEHVRAAGGGAVSVEEHSVIGGLGGALAELLSAHGLRLVRVGIEDRFGQSGKPEELLAHYGLTVERIVQAVRRADGRFQ